MRTDASGRGSGAGPCFGVSDPADDTMLTTWLLHQSLGLLLLGMLRALCTLVPSGYDKIVPVDITYATTKMVVSESMDIDIGSALAQHARRHSFQAPLLIR